MQFIWKHHAAFIGVWHRKVLKEFEKNYKLYTTVRKLGAKLRNENQSVAVHMIIFQTKHRSMLLIKCCAKKGL